MQLLQFVQFVHRAGEIIPEVEGTSPWGPSRKRVLKCLKGPKTTYTTIAIGEKQSKRSKRAHFVMYRVPRVPPRTKWNSWGPEGKVPPGSPGFSSHVCTVVQLGALLLQGSVPNSDEDLRSNI